MRFLVLLLFLVASAQAQSLGTTTFPNSGAAEAQGPFLRGLLLLHSFEYDDAADAFREAQALDPGFAMAFWGEAMTYNHPIWMQQDRDAAMQALAKIPDLKIQIRHQARAGHPGHSQKLQIKLFSGWAKLFQVSWAKEHGFIHNQDMRNAKGAEFL